MLRWRPLQVVVLAAGMVGMVTCMAQDEAASNEFADPWGVGVTKGGGKGANMASIPVGGGAATSGVGGTGGVEGLPGGGGAGGDPEYFDISDECKELASTRFDFTMSVERSNATGSPVYVRDVLKNEDGLLPSQAMIKPQEFLNYYTIDYGVPIAEVLGMTARLEEIGENTGEHRILVGLSALPPLPRPRMTATIVVDNSPSMTGNSMVRARAVVGSIAASMKDGDVVSLVTWNPDGPPILNGHIVTKSIETPEDPVIKGSLQKVYAGGSADLHAGLTRGYELAKLHYTAGGLNRLVFITDGRVTVGEPELQYISAHASGDVDEKSIHLVGVSTGASKGYDDATMMRMTTAGRGSSIYIDSVAEAEQIFEARFDEVMDVAMTNVVLVMSLPGYFNIPTFFNGSPGYSTDPGEVVGQPLAPGDSMTFNHIVTACHPDVVNNDDLISLRLRWTMPDGVPMEKSETLTVGALLAAQGNGLKKAKAVLLYAEALKAELNPNLHAAYDEIAAIQAELQDPELEEIMALIKRHPNY
jgi:Ca-activated chloride channel family protein